MMMRIYSRKGALLYLKTDVVLECVDYWAWSPSHLTLKSCGYDLRHLYFKSINIIHYVNLVNN